MKKNPIMTAVDIEETACCGCTEQNPFRCPHIMMADTCSDCSQFSSDGYCRKWGGYVDADKWACSWYYDN